MSNKPTRGAPRCCRSPSKCATTYPIRSRRAPALTATMFKFVGTEAVQIWLYNFGCTSIPKCRVLKNVFESVVDIFLIPICERSGPKTRFPCFCRSGRATIPRAATLTGNYAFVPRGEELYRKQGAWKKPGPQTNG